MLPRSALLLAALAGFSLSATSEAEARRLGGIGKLFSSGSARAAAPARPAVPPRPPAAAAPATRSGTFVFVGGSRPATASAEERKEPGANRPMLATMGGPTTVNAPPAAPKAPRPAYGFETVTPAAPTSGFSAVTMGN